MTKSAAQLLYGPVLVELSAASAGYGVRAGWRGTELGTGRARGGRETAAVAAPQYRVGEL